MATKISTHILKAKNTGTQTIFKWARERPLAEIHRIARDEKSWMDCDFYQWRGWRPSKN